MTTDEQRALLVEFLASCADDEPITEADIDRFLRERQSQVTQPAPQRFWRVLWESGRFNAWMVTRNGEPVVGEFALNRPGATFEEAKAGGRASGLPEWKP